MDDLVIISWSTAQFCSILIGQNDWGNQIVRAAASADLGNAMGTRKMETSLECFAFDAKDNKLGKDMLERKAILRYLRKNPGTESLVAAIEAGEHNKKDK